MIKKIKSIGVQLFLWCLVFLPLMQIAQADTASTDPVTPVNSSLSGNLTSTNGGIVPCGNGNDSPCTLCHLVLGVQNIIKWGMNVMTYFALVLLVAMGIIYIVSAGNTGMISTAKSGIKNILIGFAVILLAYVVINTFLFVLANNGVGHASSWGSFTCDTTSSGGTVGSSSLTPVTNSNPNAGNGVGGDCSKYDFASVAQSTGVDKCLLESISKAESGCNPTLVNNEDCGLMQINAANAGGQSCEDRKNTPTIQIQKAAAILKANQGALNMYKGVFNIGNSFSLSGSKIQIAGQGNFYDTGNDDLIASYNTGTGNASSKNPFHVSADCPGGVPAWQCPINPGEFGPATQPHVARIQEYQKKCMQQ